MERGSAGRSGESVMNSEILNKLKNITTDDIKNKMMSIDRGTWMRLIVGLLVLGVVSVFFIYPAWISRLAVRSKISAMEIQLNTAKLLVSQEKQIEENREMLLKKNETVQKRFYSSSESSQLLGVISRLAQESKVVIVASDPKPAEPFPAPWDQKYMTVAYGLTLEGSYHNLALFISKLESSNSLLRLQSYSLKPQEKAPDKHFAEMILYGFVKKS